MLLLAVRTTPDSSIAQYSQRRGTVNLPPASMESPVALLLGRVELAQAPTDRIQPTLEPVSLRA